MRGMMVKCLRMSGQSSAIGDRHECPVSKEEKIVNIIETLENEQLRNDIPEFRPGDTVRVHTKVVEGKNERIQVFEGVVIARKHAGLRETFTVRRISYGVGVERTFFVHSPRGKDRTETPRHRSPCEALISARTVRQSGKNQRKKIMS